MRRLIIERSAIRNNMAVIKERAQGAALYGVVSGQGGGVAPCAWPGCSGMPV